MPPHNIHRKYCERLGIPDDVCRTIDKYIDGANPERKHDIWRNFIEVEKISEDEYTLNILRRYWGDATDIIFRRHVDKTLHYVIRRYYKFRGRMFSLSEHYRYIKSFDNGLEVFFLHMILDIFENCLRPLNLRIRNMYSFYIFIYDADSMFEDDILRMVGFTRRHLHEIQGDISRYIERKYGSLPRGIIEGISFTPPQ